MKSWSGQVVVEGKEVWKLVSRADVQVLCSRSPVPMDELIGTLVVYWDLLQVVFLAWIACSVSHVFSGESDLIVLVFAYL